MPQYRRFIPTVLQCGMLQSSGFGVIVVCDIAASEFGSCYITGYSVLRRCIRYRSLSVLVLLQYINRGSLRVFGVTIVSDAAVSGFVVTPVCYILQSPRYGATIGCSVFVSVQSPMFWRYCSCCAILQYQTCTVYKRIMFVYNTRERFICCRSRIEGMVLLPPFQFTCP